MFNIYLYVRSRLIGFANGDLISGLKMAEYFREVNPPPVHRSAVGEGDVWACDLSGLSHAAKDKSAGAKPKPSLITWRKI
ncbi:MAG: hypothetical protein J2P52_00710 [Blastocatellia bacterium]|nr:hypothetical protein [Blastocatellia bacterium]